ncbi:MAG TPA: response regulator [Myxococcota bacterium]|nr:response regulator [Myxococcota bacterium]
MNPHQVEILVVDDNAANLKLARVILQREGYLVRTAVDAEEALELLSTWRPALILMDIQLPGLDGLELTRRLKASPEHRDTIIVALTAFAMPSDHERARAAGCDGYLSKPIDIDTLVLAVSQHLGTGAGS